MDSLHLRYKLYSRSIIGLSALLVLILAVAEIHSFDLFWQLQSGKYMLETLSVIKHDTFSLAADASRYEHCWLHDILFYLIYLAGGFAAISFVKGLLLTATYACLTLTASHRGAVFSIVLISLPAFLITSWAWLARPQLWTFLLFALFVLILERHQRKGDRWLFVLLPLFIFWANLHAGSALAFLVVVAFLAGMTCEHFFKRVDSPTTALKRLALLMVGLVISSFSTPYGSSVLLTLFNAPRQGADMGSVFQEFNIDWHITTFAEFPQFYISVVACAVLMTVSWRKMKLTDLFLLGGLSLMGWRLGRHTTFLFFGLAALMPFYLDQFFNIMRHWLPRGHLAVKVLIVSLLLFQSGQYLWSTSLREGPWQTGLKTWYYPIAATDFVIEHQLPANLYNTYAWGGYLMWRLYPEYKVFWDGRQDSLEMYSQGLRVQSGEVGWDRVLDDYAVNTLVLKALAVNRGARFPILDRMRESDSWALVFTDQSSLVFVRRSAMPVSWLKQYEQPKTKIDQVILSEGNLMLGEHGTNRYRVYWEAFRIAFAKQDYQSAWQNLQSFKQRAPQEVRDKKIVHHYEQLLEQRIREPK